jgi:hypothetical protein
MEAGSRSGKHAERALGEVATSPQASADCPPTSGLVGSCSGSSSQQFSSNCIFLVGRRSGRDEDRPTSSAPPSVTSTPCRERLFATSAAECVVAKAFALKTVTTRTRFAFSSTGMASAIARAAVRLKSHATTTVLSSNDFVRGRSGKTRVGLPDPKITASAYH